MQTAHRALALALILSLGPLVVAAQTQDSQTSGEVEKDLKRAAAGNAAAQVELGNRYSAGNGVSWDPAQALAWYRKAAEQGYAPAQLQLGNIYFQGIGVSRDYTLALAWYRKSADQGNAYAQYGLGTMYKAGWGVSQDNAQALVWFRKSAEQGHAWAQYYLGDLYEGDLGVEPDTAQAHFWLQKAANSGIQNAKDELAKLDAALAPATTQIAQTQSNPSVDTSAQDDEAAAKKAEDEEKISELEQDIEELQHEVETYENSVEQLSNCSGIGAAICEAGAAKAQSNANKANNQIDEKRREIARLQGEEVQNTVKRSTDTAEIYTSHQTSQNGNGNSQPPVVVSNHSYPSTSSSQPSQSCRNMGYFVQVVSSTYDANHFLHVVVKNNCGSSVRITTSTYAPNRSCTVDQTANFNSGDSQDMGAVTDRTWYQVQADDSVRSSVDGSGCRLVIPNSCN